MICPPAPLPVRLEVSSCHFSFHFCNLLSEANTPTLPNIGIALLLSCGADSLFVQSWFLDMTTTKKFLLWFIFIFIFAWVVVRILQLNESSNKAKMRFDIGSTVIRMFVAKA
jgi:hypothetical protein